MRELQRYRGGLNHCCECGKEFNSGDAILIGRDTFNKTELVFCPSSVVGDMESCVVRYVFKKGIPVITNAGRFEKRRWVNRLKRFFG